MAKTVHDGGRPTRVKRDERFLACLGRQQYGGANDRPLTHAGGVKMFGVNSAWVVQNFFARLCRSERASLQLQLLFQDIVVA